MSNVNRVRLPAAAASPAGSGAPSITTPSGVAPPRVPLAPAAANLAATTFPSAEGTAILNLSAEQVEGIRSLLIGLRTGKKVVNDVRKQIFGMLSGGQKRVLGAAWFIISVRV